jgi:hypothetical protein
MQENKNNINDGIKNRRESPQTYRNRRLATAIIGPLTAFGALTAGSHVVETVQNRLEDGRIDSQLSHPDAVADVQAGNIDEKKVVIVKATESGTAWNAAEDLKPTGDIREVSDVISAQVGADGVQAGESFAVDKNDIAQQPQDRQIASGQ